MLLFKDSLYSRAAWLSRGAMRVAEMCVWRAFDARFNKSVWEIASSFGVVNNFKFEMFSITCGTSIRCTRDDAHDHLWEQHTFTSAQKRTSATQRITLRRIRARFLSSRSLSRERAWLFSNQPTLYFFIWGVWEKGTSPTTQRTGNDTSENNNALNNLFSFSHHRKQQSRFQRRRRRKREREGPERRGFSVRFLIVQSSSRRRRRKDASASAEKPEKKREYDAENIPPVRARFAPKRVVVFRKRRQRRRSIVVVVVVERWWFCGDDSCEQF